MTSMTRLIEQPSAATEPARGPAEAPTLRIEGLAVSFAGRGGSASRRAVDGVSLSVYKDQTLAVVGESGCGKSVTAMSVLRLLPEPPARYEAGRVLLSRRDGDEPVDVLGLQGRELRAVRGGVAAMIFQEPMTSLNPVYTIGDQIVEAILLHQPVGRAEAKERAARALEEVGIERAAARLRSYPHEFSGGMRQRAMIAMALACTPRLLLADEPTTALDVTVQAQVLELLRRLQRERGMAMLLITHALGVVAENADVVCVMYGGRVAEYARVERLFEMPLHPYTRGLLRCAPSMTSRAARLVTVREVVDDPREFDMPAGMGAGLRPWWPEHAAPAGVRLVDEPGGDSTMAEVEPGHWVRVWRTEAALSRATTRADLPPVARGV